jgi:hypothetical protein
MKEQKIKAWHFVADSRILAHSDLAVEAGCIYGEPEGEIVICKRGMHASRRVYDALSFAPGAQLCRVACWGDVAEHADKLVSRYREVIAIKDVSAELRLWGCWCIRNTPIGGGKTVWDLLTDERSRKAVEVAERFARNEVTRKELAAAWAAAREAAWEAARAAWAAAWEAARAARTAAREAAWEAAWAAGAAGWEAAGAATSKFQADELDRRMLALFGE